MDMEEMKLFLIALTPMNNFNFDKIIIKHIIVFICLIIITTIYFVLKKPKKLPIPKLSSYIKSALYKCDRGSGIDVKTWLDNVIDS
jgi:hypothetical protein